MSEPWSYEEQKAELLDAQCIYGIFHKITDECIYVGQCTGKAGSLEVGRWGQHAISCFSKEKWNRAVYVRMRRDTLRMYEVRVLEEYESEQLLSIYELCVREQHYLDELNPPCNMRRAFDANVARRERNARRYRERKDREREAARGEGQPPTTTTLEQYGFQVLKSS